MNRLFKTSAILAVAAIIAACLIPVSHVVHVVPVPGRLNEEVRFFQKGTIFGSRGPVYVRFPDGAEAKIPTFPDEASFEDSRGQLAVTYVGGALNIYGPKGLILTVPGYTF